MVEVKIIYEGKQSMQEVANKFKSQLSEREIMKTAAFTINETLRRASGSIRTEITKDFAITKKNLKDTIFVTKKASGTTGGLYGNLSYSFKGIPLYKFKNKSLDKSVGFVTYNKKIKGVQVEIKKGKKTVLKHTFIKAMPNGHVGIWGHGSYIGGKFIGEDRKTSKGKPVISEMLTSSPFGIITSEKTTAKIKADINKNLTSRFEILLQNKLNKLNR